MIFSIIIAAALSFVALYGLLHKKQFPVIGSALPPVCLVGIYFALVPAHSTILANAVGIGRGADLLIYTAILVLGFISLTLHLKLSVQHRQLTELSRKFAIATSLVPRASQSDRPSLRSIPPSPPSPSAVRATGDHSDSTNTASAKPIEMT